MPSAIISNMSINPDEINLDDDEDDIGKIILLFCLNVIFCLWIELLVDNAIIAETASAENEPKSDTSDVANKEENATPLSPLTSAEEDEKERSLWINDFYLFMLGLSHYIFCQLQAKRCPRL